MPATVGGGDARARKGTIDMQHTADQYERFALDELEQAAKVDRSGVPNALHVQRALVFATLAVASVHDARSERAAPRHDE